MRKVLELRPVDAANAIQRELRLREMKLRNKPKYVKPSTTIIYSQAENRHGKKIQLRDLRFNGYLKVYRNKQGTHWCYYERGDSGKLQQVVASPGWNDVMTTFRPDSVPITAEWVKKINLRLRAFH